MSTTLTEEERLRLQNLVIGITTGPLTASVVHVELNGKKVRHIALIHVDELEEGSQDQTFVILALLPTEELTMSLTDEKGQPAFRFSPRTVN